MLGSAFKWSDSEDMFVLFLRYGSVATVKRRGPGPVEIEINWQGHKVRGPEGLVISKQTSAATSAGVAEAGALQLRFLTRV